MCTDELIGGGEWFDWSVLRIRRYVVLCLFLICVGTAFSFWVAGQPGAEDAGRLLPPPPLAGVKLDAGRTGMTTAVNVTASPDAQWLTEAAAQTGIPSRALRAYVAAAATANGSSPACGIGWNTLAAIGSVESAHGTYGGGSLNTAGQASGAIVGPSLDGEGFAAIAGYRRRRTGRRCPLGPRRRTHAVHSLHLAAGGPGRQRRWNSGPLQYRRRCPQRCDLSVRSTAVTCGPPKGGRTPSTRTTSPTPTSAASRTKRSPTQR